MSKKNEKKTAKGKASAVKKNTKTPKSEPSKNAEATEQNATDTEAVEKWRRISLRLPESFAEELDAAYDAEQQRTGAAGFKEQYRGQQFVNVCLMTQDLQQKMTELTTKPAAETETEEKKKEVFRKQLTVQNDTIRLLEGNLQSEKKKSRWMMYGLMGVGTLFLIFLLWAARKINRAVSAEI